MSSPSNPFEDVERLFDRMSRQFDEMSRMWESESPLGWGRESETMAVDLADHDEEFVATVDLPGFERDDVHIRVTNHTLRIDAERESEREEKDEQFLRHERSHRSMHRSIRLPEEVDTDNVSARMRNGVLTITLPKIEVEEAREIEIT